MPVHPSTGAPAALVCRVIDHLGCQGGYSSEPATPTLKPLQFAAWPDGTLIWDDSALVADPNAYRIARVDPAQVQRLLQRARERFATLPEPSMGLPFGLSGGSEQVIALAEGESYFSVSWGGNKDTPLYPVIAPVWRDVRMMVYEAIPSQGDVIALDLGH